MGPLSIIPSTLIHDVPAGWALSVLCSCGRSNPTLVPLARLVAEGRGGLSILEAAERLRCKGCGKRAPTVSLTDRPAQKRPWEPVKPGATISIKPGGQAA